MKALLVVLAAMALAGCAEGSGETATRPLVSQAPGASEAAELTAAPEVSAPPAATFKDIPLTGKGKKIAKFNIPEGTAAIALITHKGKSNFIVHSVDASGETVSGLVNVIGNYSGTVLFDAGADEHSVAFEIDADGAWTITVKPVTSAKTWNPTTILKGTGDSVYRLVPP